MPDLAQTFHDLVRVETVLWNAVDKRLRAEFGLTLARLETMQVLGRSGPCRVQDIAGELVIGMSGASKIVDRVEAAGHCRRRPNPADARSSLITLTPPGRVLLRKADACLDSELESLLGGALTVAQLRDLSRALARLRRAPGPGGPSRTVSRSFPA